MFGRWSLFRLLFALILIAALVGGGYALYRAGYSQGYVASSLDSGDAEELVRPFGFPYPAPYMHPFSGFHPRFFGFGLFLLVGFVIMAMTFRFFGFMAWRRCAGPDDEKWGKDWHRRGPGRYWGPPGPWGPPEDQAESDAEEEDASASES